MYGLIFLIIGAFLFAVIGVVGLLVRTGSHSEGLKNGERETASLKRYAALLEERIAVLERAFTDAGFRPAAPVPPLQPQDADSLPAHFAPGTPPPAAQTPPLLPVQMPPEHSPGEDLPPRPAAQTPAREAPFSYKMETETQEADTAEPQTAPPDSPIDTTDTAPPGSETSAPPSLIRTFLSFIKGGNLWVAAGVFLLFIAFALLISYMARRGFFTVEMRIAASIVSGLAMLVFGWKFRRKKPVYALVIQGGGIGVLYLSFFAASKLTTILPAPAALVLVSLLIPSTIVLSLIQEAQALAVFGLLGGFAAPILLSSGSNNYVGLFSYYLILDAAVLIIGHFRLWRVLNLCAALCSFTVALIWIADRYQPEMFAGVEPFMISYILLFTFIGIRTSRSRKISLRNYVDLPITIGTPFLGALIQWRICSYFDHGPAIVCIAFSTFYLLLTWILWKKKGVSIRGLAEGYLGLSVLLANLSIPLELSPRVTSAVWAAEGLLIYIFGCRHNSRRLRITAHIFHAASVIAFLAQAGDFYYIDSYPAFRSPLFSGGLIIALSALITAIVGSRQKPRAPEQEAARLPAGKALPFFYAVWGFLWWYSTWGIELTRVSIWPLAWFFVCASLTALAACAVGKFFKCPSLYLSIAAALLTALYITARFILPSFVWRLHYDFLDILTINFFTPPYLWGWLLFFASQTFLLLRGRPSKLLSITDNKDTDNKENKNNTDNISSLQKIHAWWMFLFIAASLIAITCSGRAAADYLGLASSWKSLAGILPSLVCVTALSLLSGRPGIPPAHKTAIHIWLPRILCAATGIWFTGTLFASGNPSPLPLYIPLINPLEIQQALCIALILLRQLSLRKAGLGPVFKTHTMFALIDIMIVLWLTAMIARATHFFLDIPLSHVPATGQFQLALLILWGILGITHILAGHKKSLRPLWLAGAALIVTDIAKLLLIDLARTGTVTRIICFFVAGIFLLFIGWAAPLPPRTTHAPKENQ